eukprot:GHVS01007055.1.p1 GENE.GHVS01007055.1~~GHVS01007055.1.p1  ORF type:complete len:576 (-),score=69.52 GHVS01007055.1:199-1926(-)
MSIEELMALVPIESAHSVKEKGRKTRWDKVKPRGPSIFGSPDDKPYLPPPYVDLPPGLSPLQIDQFLREQRYDDLARKLASGELEFGEPDIRPPSPPPTYDRNGGRTNTRDVRVRSAMMAEYYRLVEFLAKHVEGFAPPADFKPMKKVKRIEIPLEKYPEYNFMGLIIGPRGCNHKRLEAESGTQISVRGKGTQKEGKKTDHQTDEEASMPMHVHIAADTEDKLEKAVGLIEPLLDPFHPMHEDFKKRGLEQLALVNGLSMSKLDQRCAVCGATGHLAYECPDAQELQTFKKPQVRCAICGDMGHVTMDCKFSRPGAEVMPDGTPGPSPPGGPHATPPPPPPGAPTSAAQTPQQQYYEKMKMDYEYQKMMNELSGGSALDELDMPGKPSPGANPPGVSPNSANPCYSPAPINYSRPQGYAPSAACPPPPPPHASEWHNGMQSWHHPRGYATNIGMGHNDYMGGGNVSCPPAWSDGQHMGMRPHPQGHPGPAGSGMPMNVNAWGPIPPPPAVAAQFQQQYQLTSQGQPNMSLMYSSGMGGTAAPWTAPCAPADAAPPLPPEMPPLPPDAPPLPGDT